MDYCALSIKLGEVIGCSEYWKLRELDANSCLYLKHLMLIVTLTFRPTTSLLHLVSKRLSTDVYVRVMYVWCMVH
jgi:hypothetical protein